MSRSTKTSSAGDRSRGDDGSDDESASEIEDEKELPLSTTHRTESGPSRLSASSQNSKGHEPHRVPGISSPEQKKPSAKREKRGDSKRAARNAAEAAKGAWEDIQEILSQAFQNGGEFDRAIVKAREREEKRKIKHLCSIEELLKGERDYAERMQFLTTPALMPGLNRDMRLKLGFSDLSTISKLSRQIVDTISGSGSMALCSDAKNRPGYAFDRYFAQMLGVYKNYCINQPNAAKFVKMLRKKDKSLFSTYDRVVLQNQRVEGVPKLPPRMLGTQLLAALMQPVQRCMRYAMLLKRIYETLPKSSRSMNDAEHSSMESTSKRQAADVAVEQTSVAVMSEARCLERAISKIEVLCERIDCDMCQPKLQQLYASIEAHRPHTMQVTRKPILCHRAFMYEVRVMLILFTDALTVVQVSDCETDVKRVLKFMDFKTNDDVKLLPLHDGVSCRIIVKGHSDRFTVSFEREFESVVESVDVHRRFMKLMDDALSGKSTNLSSVLFDDTLTINVPRFEEDENGVVWYECHIVPSALLKGVRKREAYIQTFANERVSKRQALDKAVESSTSTMTSSGSEARGWTTFVRFKQCKELMADIRQHTKLINAPSFDDSNSSSVTWLGASALSNARLRKDRLGDFLDACARHPVVRTFDTFKTLVNKLSSHASKRRIRKALSAVVVPSSIAEKEESPSGAVVISV